MLLQPKICHYLQIIDITVTLTSSYEAYLHLRIEKGNSKKKYLKILLLLLFFKKWLRNSSRLRNLARANFKILFRFYIFLEM